jgi:uncharacterized protein (DUF1330 family)
MAAYVIADVKVSKPDQYEQYRALSPGAISAAGGKFIVRGGRHETLEGTWRPGRVVVLEFPTFQQAKDFYESELYRAARRVRAGATEQFNLIVVEGI